MGKGELLKLHSSHKGMWAKFLVMQIREGAMSSLFPWMSCALHGRTYTQVHTSMDYDQLIHDRIYVQASFHTIALVCRCNTVAESVWICLCTSEARSSRPHCWICLAAPEVDLNITVSLTALVATKGTPSSAQICFWKTWCSP